MKSNLYLVRHAQSQSNVDNSILKDKTNVGIHLTEIGIAQAKETGKFLVEELSQNITLDHKLKIWNSPYERTRQTSSIIKEELKKAGLTFVEEESIHIAEKQFGLLDDVTDYENQYSAENAHYLLHKNEQKDFFARPPLGESSFDMCQRLDFFLRSVIAPENEYIHIIVSHGAALRGLIMMHDKLTYENYLEMPNPYNASVLHLHGLKGFVGELFAPTVKTR